MEDFTGVRVKDLKKRSFKVSNIHLIFLVFMMPQIVGTAAIKVADLK
jgi:hypothetical protein